MKDAILVIIVARPVSDAQDTSARTRSSSRAYDEGWERTFGQRPEPKQARPN